MPIPASQLPVNVLNALQQGDTIEAIKRLRQSSGLGLKEAKDVIDDHLRGLPVSITPSESADALPPAVVDALQRGNKIEAIKLLREHSGLGLKEAKDAVEASQVEVNTGARRLAPGEVPRSRLGWFAPLMIAGIAAYYFFRR